MEFEYTEEQKMIRDMVRDFAESEIRPRLQEIDYEGKFPRDLVCKMGELGLMGLSIPEEYGGAGADAIFESVGCDGNASSDVARRQFRT